MKTIWENCRRGSENRELRAPHATQLSSAGSTATVWLKYSLLHNFPLFIKYITLGIIIHAWNGNRNFEQGTVTPNRSRLQALRKLIKTERPLPIKVAKRTATHPLNMHEIPIINSLLVGGAWHLNLPNLLAYKNLCFMVLYYLHKYAYMFYNFNRFYSTKSLMVK